MVSLKHVSYPHTVDSYTTKRWKILTLVESNCNLIAGKHLQILGVNVTVTWKISL